MTRKRAHLKKLRKRDLNRHLSNQTKFLNENIHWVFRPSSEMPYEQRSNAVKRLDECARVEKLEKLTLFMVDDWAPVRTLASMRYKYLELRSAALV